MHSVDLERYQGKEVGIELSGIKTYMEETRAAKTYAGIRTMNAFAILLRVIFASIAVFCLGCDERSKRTVSVNSAQSPLVITLKGEDRLLSSEQSQFVVDYKNAGSETIRLYKILFSPRLAIRIYSEDGLEVPRGLPPTPKSFEKSDTTDLRPGQSWDFVFRIKDVTPINLNGKRLMVECIYDTTTGYSPEYEIWRGRGVSNKLEIRLK